MMSLQLELVLVGLKDEFSRFRKYVSKKFAGHLKQNGEWPHFTICVCVSLNGLLSARERLRPFLTTADSFLLFQLFRDFQRLFQPYFVLLKGMEAATISSKFSQSGELFFFINFSYILWNFRQKIFVCCRFLLPSRSDHKSIMQKRKTICCCHLLRQREKMTMLGMGGNAIFETFQTIPCEICIFRKYFLFREV